MEKEQKIGGGHDDNKKFACKAAEIKGKYRTIACQDEQLNQIHENLSK